MGMQRQRSEFYARYRILYPRSECKRAHLRWFHALHKAAEAALDQAEAQYRATVITAFQNVADALRALQSDARAVKAARRAEDTAKASLDIVQKQLNAGQVNQLAVLNAQQTYLTAYACRRKPIVSPIPPHCLWRSAAVGPRPAQHRFGGNARWAIRPPRKFPRSSWIIIFFASVETSNPAMSALRLLSGEERT